MPIPLPALGIQTPQQPDVLSQVAKIRQIQGMGQEQQLRGQQIQAGQLENQMRQRELQDQQTTMAILGKHQGDIESALPELASSVSAKTFIGLQKSAVELRQTTAKMKGEELDNKLKTDNLMLGLIGEASKIPPEQWPAQFPAVAAKALEIDPTLKGHIDPNQPIPQSALQQFGLLYQTQTTSLAKEAAQRQAAAQQETARHNQAMEGARSTEPVPLVKGGKLHSVLVDKKTGEEVKDLGETRQPAATNLMTSNDAKDIADAIANGDQPPTLQGLYRNAAPVRAELARRGVPLAQMETDWKATQKYMGTLNGAQQVRLRQAVTSASDLADKVDDLYKQYHDAVGDAGMKTFNKAGLIAAQNLPGKAGALAHALVAQISDLTADLGNVYMGGNSPTDHALELAGKNLSADWNRAAFEEGIKQIHANIKIRQNSITHGAPAGLSGDTNYFNPAANTSTPGAPAAPAAGDFFSKFGGKSK